MGRHAAASNRAAEEFERMVRPHLPALHAYVLRHTGGDETATEQVLDETLSRAAREPRRDLGVRPWLLLTARTVLRGGNRRATMPPAAVVAAMRELAPADRELIVRTYYGGASLAELAAGRGVPIARIKSDLFFAMRAVRAVLDQQVPK
ncbi:RNA polymerase sigma factor [Actinoplanes philippinensis]|uniref:RNA polymerase sigma-70 factor, ECF subfamily n=1 Tax=Actinoplanes philippinensis TaxID=35752 RepID=A0A1I1ZU93_9ACTN|nr:sigma factor-like helix-turn-helix DNA-binding protein [Actinoplanes philippinensis]GIE75289.1 RNA polymerase sigma factor [Actinoplanes philippinensis]SFE35195.1 RNA polymerase sigma-70 factor, ECF subfamily [Actinoplanes philippinensis]